MGGLLDRFRKNVGNNSGQSETTNESSRLPDASLAVASFRASTAGNHCPCPELHTIKRELSEMKTELTEMKTDIVLIFTRLMELTHAFQELKKYFEISVLPRTVTPAVSISDHLGYGASPNMNDPEQIKRSLLNLAKSGEIISAFVQACNYGEVSILMHLCKNIDPGKVFEAKLPHQTHVSILQNMVTDIHHETETKLAYLNTAIGTLDTTDRKTFQSVGRVLPVFQASVAKFISQNPSSKLISNIKLLEMALVGIGQQMHSPQQTHSGHSGQTMGGQHSVGLFDKYHSVTV